jgi:hypothetical protein
VGGIAGCSRDRQYGKRAHALRAVDQYTFDIRSRGGPARNEA